MIIKWSLSDTIQVAFLIKEMLRILDKAEISNLMNTKYDNVGGIQNLILRNIQASVRLKDEVSINEFIMNQVLNQLHSSLDQLKVTYNAQKNK